MAFRFGVLSHIRLLAFVPAALFALLAGAGIAFNVSDRIQLHHFAQYLAEDVLADQLVHALQLERGRSVLFIEDKQNENVRLAETRADTNEAWDVLFIDTADVSPEVAFKIRRFREEFQGRVSGLREKIDQSHLSSEQVIVLYSQAIDDVFSIIIDMDMGATTRLPARFGDIRDHLRAHSVVSRMKEIAGRERALAVIAFSRDGFDQANILRFAEAVSQQNSLIKMLDVLMPEGSEPLLKSLRQTEDVLELGPIRQALLAGMGSKAITHDAWFQMATHRIDAINDLENQLHDAMFMLIDKRQDTLNMQSALGAGAAAFFLLLAALAARRTARLAIHPLERLIGSIEQLRQGEHKIEIADRERLDEIGAMARAVDQFRQDLLRAESRKAAMINAAMDGIILMDSGGRFVDLNANAEKIFGVTRDEVIGKDLADTIIPLRYREAHRQGMARHLATGISSIIGKRIEIEAWRKSGEFPVELAVSSFSDGGQTMFIAYVRDISDRRLAESALRDSETALRTMINTAADDYLALWDKDGNLKIANFMPNDMLVQVGREVLRTGLPKRFEDRVEGKWFDYNFYPAITSDGVIAGATVFARDITARKDYEERLFYQANYDELTGLPNRLYAIGKLNKAIKEMPPEKGHVIILVIDLDDFKKVNDTLGHPVGDRLLQMAGERIGMCMGVNGVIARLGGDEFLVILSGMEATVFGELVAKKILEAFARPFAIDGFTIFTTASIGISVAPRDGKNAVELLRNADAAMYRAKELGRNAYRYFTFQMTEDASRRMQVESQLRFALERGELYLNYQPIVDMDSGRMRGAEALLRWRNPELGFIPPDAFIPLAEETGLIVPIGAWVLEEACRSCKSWRDRFGGSFHVAVNISSRQFRGSDLLAVVRKALDGANLPPDGLELEVTERLLMNDIDETVIILDEFRRMGVRLSIDDFGTGYSSLSYLKRFPFDTLKIDKSFVQEIGLDAEGTGIVDAIVAMAHSLDMKLIAEGVENDKQRAYLAGRGVEYAQGYFFGKPMDDEKLSEFILTQSQENLASQ